MQNEPVKIGEMDFTIDEQIWVRGDKNHPGRGSIVDWIITVNGLTYRIKSRNLIGYRAFKHAYAIAALKTDPKKFYGGILKFPKLTKDDWIDIVNAAMQRIPPVQGGPPLRID